MDLFACPPAAAAYNAIMDALVDAAYHDQAHKVYVRMLAAGVSPNVHTHTIRLRSFCLTARPHIALRLLRTLPDRGCDARAVAYCTVVCGLYGHGHSHDARHLFDEMLHRHVFPNLAAFNKVLHALCKKGDVLEAGLLLGKVIKRGLPINLFTYNIWIRGLCEAGRLAEAVRLVDEMHAYAVPDVVTYNTLIRGLCKESKPQEAMQYLRRMMNQGCLPDDFTYNTIIDGYCKMSMVREATELLKDAVFKGFVPDQVTYCSLINGLCAEGDVERALELFNEAQAKGIKPDLVVYNSLIKGLCLQGLILHALQVMNEMSEDGCHPDIRTYNIVINGLCKMGNISDATVVMNDAIMKGYLPDVFTFNTLIDGYCKRLKLDSALQLVERMWTYGITPDAITYNSVLNGLCKARKMYSTIYCLEYGNWRASDPKCKNTMEGCVEINVDGAIPICLQCVFTLVFSSILTWGDVYVDKVITDTERDLYDSPIGSKNQIVLSTLHNNGQYHQSYPLCPIEAALLSMSSHSYSLGEELIGKVALTGQHCWISSNELSSTFMYKYHEDWQLQFAAGIKTVLFVPVVPHGVLQLGSLDLVSESSTSVALIKDLFYELYDASTSGSSSGTGCSYSNTWRQPAATLPINSPDVPHDFFYSIKSSAQLLNSDHPSLPHAFPMLEFPLSEDNIVSIYDTSLTACPAEPLDGNDTGIWTNAHEELSQFTHCNTASEPDKANISYMDKLINQDSKVICRSVGHMEDPGYGNIDHFTLTEMACENREHWSTSNDDAVTSNSSFQSELHKTLEPISREEHEDCMWHIRLRQQGPTGSALLQENGNKAGFYKQHENNDYEEFLLDAIIDQVIRTSNSKSSHSTDSPVSCATQIQKEDHVLRLDESSVPSLPGGQDFSFISIDEGFMRSTMTGSSPTQTNKTILVEEFIGDPIEGMHRETAVEIKGRCRKTGLHRPRPRDRQLIQDRMKELRQLVPNTSKCSIDALLDKTIAHMQFLRSVSEKADKLEKIISSEESTKRQPGSCPLKVEELDQPGHLLIEMLCEEYGVFLEIAHVLKGLEVSILKGLLESRSDELWARFVIQTSQGFDQMQILCPLMHLLQRQRWS
ncbi:hypothetical protein E2562_004617 [Oryza meyeriana var. granulata]|uniref:BHLH domain-containing protein n=1 Tax=Oryza meyeriana var. granulata TaxID=110450 RepID=A0A6G1F3L4_9ORYZ|nr:hypothetical protein E2562_004617 [Oryza meyeriana var. granulata]